MSEVPNIRAVPTTTVIRHLRARKGWSQERLAQEAGVTTGTINKAERGIQVPTIMNQYRIAEALGVEPTDIWPDEVAS